MVSSETLQIIIDAKDLVSNKANQVKNALKQTGQAAQQANQQAANSTSRVSSAYDRMKTRVTNAWNSIKQTITNSSTFKTVSESALAQPFLSAAEKIKQRYSSMTETVKGKLRLLTSETAQQAAQSSGKLSLLDSALIKIGTTGSAAVTRLKGAFTTLQGHITTLKGKVSNFLSSFSGLQGAVSGVFGALGVSSMKSFIIDAGIAREKVNAVTKSIVGSGDAFKRMDASIKTAVAGTTLGYNNVAKAVNNVGLRYHMTAQQLEKVPGVMSKVGMMAQAMGKSNEEAAAMMEAAYDGLMGKWRSLKTLGITKEDLMAAGWSGAADDVNGYSDALEKVLSKNPQLKEMMNSTEYQMESLKMAVKGVGTEIGVAILPYIKSLLKFILDVKKNNPELFKLVVIIGVVIMVISSLAAVLLPIAMLLSTIGLAAAGVILLIAALAAGVYLAYTHFQQVRDVMQPVIQAFQDLGQAFQDLMNGKISIWDFLGKLLWALAQIPTIIPRVIAGLLAVVWDWLMGELGKIGDGLSQWITGMYNDLVSWLTSGGSSVTSWISTAASNLWNTVLEALTGFWEGVVAWGQSIYTSISDWITGLGEWIFTSLIPFFSNLLTNLGTFFLNIITGVGTFFVNLLMGLYNWNMSILTTVVNFLVGLWNQFVTWAQNIVNGFIQWIMTLPGRMYLWLLDAYNRASQWAIQTINKFKDAANKSVSGFIQWLSTLPGKAWTWLMNTINKITSFASQAIEKMKNAAKDACDKFIQYFKDLPQKVWDELMRIGDKILQAGGTLAQKARELGQRIVDELMAPFKFGSPGIISRSVAAEMVYLKEFLDDSVHPLVKSASNVGDSVTDALSSHLDLNQNSLEALQDENLILQTVKDYEEGTLTLKHESKEEELSLLRDLKDLFTELLSILSTDEKDTSNTAVIINSMENASGTDILGVLREHISDRDIIRQIASSPDFQELDTRNKNSILNRLNRHL